MALDTVADYVAEARVLLQDTVQTYRYPDADFVTALNLAVLDSRRLRPDLWLSVQTLPSYTAPPDTTAVNIDVQYRTAFLYYVCGNVQLRDEEEESDTRAGVFMKKFENILTGGAS